MVLNTPLSMYCNRFSIVKPLNANPIKWLNTLKQFVSYSRRIVGDFDCSVGLTLKRVKLLMNKNKKLYSACSKMSSYVDMKNFGMQHDLRKYTICQPLVLEHLHFVEKKIDANGKTSVTLMKHSEMKMSQKCFYLFPIKDQLPLMNTALTSGVLFRTDLVLTLFRIGGGGQKGSLPVFPLDFLLT